jgi:hypothetical protein
MRIFLYASSKSFTVLALIFRLFIYFEFCILCKRKISISFFAIRLSTLFLEENVLFSVKWSFSPVLKINCLEVWVYSCTLNYSPGVHIFFKTDFESITKFHSVCNQDDSELIRLQVL